MIAVVVSVVNKCDYCINHHAKALNHYWKNTERLKKFILTFDDPTFSEKFKLAIKYASKLTLNPSSINKEDIDELKKIRMDG